MSAKDYYGSAYPQQYNYAAPPQNQYASPSGQVAPYNGYAPPSQPQYTSTPTAYGAQPAYSSPSPYGQPQDQQGDQEKGLVATVVGGGAGGVLGHKIGKGSKFKTLLGAAAGAAVANAVEHRLPGGKHNKHSGGHHHNSGGYPQQPQYGNAGYGRQSSHHAGPSGVAGLLTPGSHHSGSSSGLMSSVGGLFGGEKPSRHSWNGSHHSGHGRW